MAGKKQQQTKRASVQREAAHKAAGSGEPVRGRDGKRYAWQKVK